MLACAGYDAVVTSRSLGTVLMLGLAGGATVTACGPRTVPAARPSLLEAATVVAAYESPARWWYHPRKAARQLARVSTEAGELFAGERGERWLVKDHPRAAAQLAPEALIAIAEGTTARWVFVGQSGTVYESENPLGPFVRSSAPYQALSHVSAQGSVILGLGQAGTLTRSANLGLSWEPVGPSGTRFTSAALGPDGVGLAVTVPEQIWGTRDAGASWDRLEVPTFGADRIDRAAGGFLVAHSLLGLRRWRPGAEPPFEPLSEPPTAPALGLGKRPLRGPDAAALAEGRATVVGSRYVEVGSIRGALRKYRFLHGPVDGALRQRELPEVERCHVVRVAGFGRWLTLACADRASSRSAAKVRFFRSGDHGKTWKQEPFTTRAHTDALKLAMGQRGELLVTGVCSSSSARRGCAPEGVHHRQLVTDKRAEPGDRPAAKRKGERGESGSKEHVELVPAAVPSLRGVAEGLTFAADGGRAYAVGRRTKSGHYAVFVSEDGGRTFEARELPQVPVTEEEDPEWREEGDRRSSVSTFSAAEDGTLGLVVRHWGHLTLVALDEQGRAISVASPPEGVDFLGAVGVRALGLSSDDVAWESLDGGVSWEPIGPLPYRVCPGDADCVLPVSCHTGGCVIGDELSRVGWRGQVDDEGMSIEPPPTAPVTFTDQRVSTPFACTLAASAWIPLEHAIGIPSAHQAAIGKAAWFVPARDEVRGAAGAWVGGAGANSEARYVSLFPPAAQPEAYAMLVSLQVEGVAGLRYRRPTSSDPILRDVRVAWMDLLHDRTVRAGLGGTIPYRPGDFGSGRGRVQLAKPSLLSIAEGGIYLRLHAQLGEVQTTFFLDGARVQEIPPVPWPASVLQAGRTEMVHVDDAHVPWLIASSGSALVRARRNGSQWEFDAVAVGFADGDHRQTWDIAYSGGTAGLAVMSSDKRGRVQLAALHRFRASGAVTDPPMDLPTQADLRSTPAGCDDAQRNTTPRVITPFLPGTRHPVVVTDATEPQRVLLTGEAVLHGAPEAPCVSAFDAELVVTDAFDERPLEGAILPTDDLEHAWLFRVAPEDEDGARRIEVRSMDCKYDPGVEVPPEVFERRGTRAP